MSESFSSSQPINNEQISSKDKEVTLFELGRASSSDFLLKNEQGNISDPGEIGLPIDIQDTNTGISQAIGVKGRISIGEGEDSKSFALITIGDKWNLVGLSKYKTLNQDGKYSEASRASSPIELSEKMLVFGRTGDSDKNAGAIGASSLWPGNKFGPTVSGTHVGFQLTEEGVIIKDLDSTNGTKLEVNLRGQNSNSTKAEFLAGRLSLSEVTAPNENVADWSRPNKKDIREQGTLDKQERYAVERLVEKIKNGRNIEIEVARINDDNKIDPKQVSDRFTSVANALLALSEPAQGGQDAKPDERRIDLSMPGMISSERRYIGDLISYVKGRRLAGDSGQLISSELDSTLWGEQGPLASNQGSEAYRAALLAVIAGAENGSLTTGQTGLGSLLHYAKTGEYRRVQMIVPS